MAGRGKQSNAAAVFARERYNSLGQMLQRFPYNIDAAWLGWRSVIHRLEVTTRPGWGFTAALWAMSLLQSLQGKLPLCIRYLQN